MIGILQKLSVTTVCEETRSVAKVNTHRAVSLSLYIRVESANSQISCCFCLVSGHRPIGLTDQSTMPAIKGKKKRMYAPKRQGGSQEVTSRKKSFVLYKKQNVLGGVKKDAYRLS